MFCAMDKAIKRWGEHATDGEPRKFARRGEGPTAENSNIAENYTWKAQNKKIQCRADLIKIANDCKRDGVPLRVLASGWSCNRFIDPTPSKDGGKALGVNIELCGELAVVGEMTDKTITAMAGTMRGPIYEVLDKKRQQLEASGECYTEEASQQVGGLIANGVHDTMQRAFTPETVPSLEARP